MVRALGSIVSAGVAAALVLGCGPGLEEGLPSPDARGDAKIGGDRSVVDATPSGPDQASGPDLWACREFFDSNYGHVDKGRAKICGGNACAFGSGDDLGLYTLAQKSWVREVSKGYFEAGRCP
jgi:hypothetical protein